MLGRLLLRRSHSGGESNVDGRCFAALGEIVPFSLFCLYFAFGTVGTVFPGSELRKVDRLICQPRIKIINKTKPSRWFVVAMPCS